jgi:hypothetical protein
MGAVTMFDVVMLVFWSAFLLWTVSQILILVFVDKSEW